MSRKPNGRSRSFQPSGEQLETARRRIMGVVGKKKRQGLAVPSLDDAVETLCREVVRPIELGSTPSEQRITIKLALERLLKDETLRFEDGALRPNSYAPKVNRLSRHVVHRDRQTARRHRPFASTHIGRR